MSNSKTSSLEVRVFLWSLYGASWCVPNKLVVTSINSFNPPDVVETVSITGQPRYLANLFKLIKVSFFSLISVLFKATTTGITTNDIIDDNVEVSITESNAISALKVEDTANTNDAIKELQAKLTDTTTSTEEKNDVYEQLRTINTNSGLEETIEKKINNNYECSAFTKIDDTSVKVVVDECENSKSLANNIMRLVQEEFDKKMYISVEFQA